MVRRALLMIALAFAVVNIFVACSSNKAEPIVKDEKTGIVVNRMSSGKMIVVAISDMYLGPEGEHRVFARERKNGRLVGNVLRVDLGGMATFKDATLEVVWVQYQIQESTGQPFRYDIEASGVRHLTQMELDDLKKGEAKKKS
jgi:hypothetical protein